MKLHSINLILPLLFSFMLLSSCSQVEEISYDVYFWSSSIAATEENSTLFIDGNEEGILYNSVNEVDCTSDEAVLDELVLLQLSDGVHQIEVRNESGELQHKGSLEFKSNRYSRSTGGSSGGTISKMEVNGNDECLIVKISF